MIFESIIVITLLVFSTVYFIQQIRWANEQEERIERWRKFIDGQTGDKHR